jgi:transposase
MRYTVKDMREQFPDDASCLQMIFDSRYGQLDACPKCGAVAPKYHRVKGRTSYACQDCGHHLYPLAGTIFEKSTTPLTDWFHAIYLFSVSKNGVSAKEIERQVGVSYKTAHRMAKMIRLLMHEHGMLGDKGAVEVDEMYIGGRRKQTEKDQKMPVMAALENGPVKTIRTGIVARTNTKTAHDFLENNVFYGSMLHTDESKIYKSLKVKQNYNHASIRHIGEEWSKDGVTTNHVESFFGHFKKSMRGTYNAVSPAYLGCYVNEFAFRYNHRNEPIFSLLLVKAGKQL